jgi:hypothetical protein
MPVLPANEAFSPALGGMLSRGQQHVAVDDRSGDVGEFLSVVLGVVAEHLESPCGVDCMAGREDPFCLFDHCPAPKCALQC